MKALRVLSLIASAAMAMGLTLSAHAYGGPGHSEHGRPPGPPPGYGGGGDHGRPPGPPPGHGGGGDHGRPPGPPPGHGGGFPPGPPPGHGGGYPPPPPPHYPPGPPPGHGGGYPPPPPPPQWGEVRREYVGRLSRNELMPLTRLFGLDRQYNGRIIDRVVVETRFAGYNQYARLSIFLNGVLEDWSETNGPSTTLNVRGWRRIGYDVRAIDLQVDGEANIDWITIYLSN